MCVVYFQVRFDGYNLRYASDGSRERLEWDNHKGIKEFKRGQIYQTIIETEINKLSYPYSFLFFFLYSKLFVQFSLTVIIKCRMLEWMFGALKSHIHQNFPSEGLNNLKTDSDSLANNSI